MKQSLRKTSSHLVLAYKYGEGTDSLTGRNFTLDAQGREMTLYIDLSSNFHTRNQGSASYGDALNLVHNHHKLKYVQCNDNLMRTRLIKAWDRTEQPRLLMCLDLGARGRFLYVVLPFSLFMGGVQLDVQEAVDLPDRSRSVPDHHHSPRSPA
jgi:hypothetical protein